MRPEDAWGLTFWDRGKCRDLIARYRSEGIYTPPSLEGTILYPGYGGGTNWGSLAFDSERQWAIVPSTQLPMVVTLIPTDNVRPMARSGDYPDSEFALQTGAPYGMRREALLSPFGLPCTAPPWGTLSAVDLRSGEIKWQVPLGSTRDLAPFFVPARTLGTPGPARERLTRGAYIPSDESDPIGTLEAALRAAIAVEPVEAKIQAAVRAGTITARWPAQQAEASLASGLISAEEAALLERAAQLRRKAIMVDDFPRDLERSELFQTTEPVSFEPLRRAFDAARRGAAA